MKKFFISHSSSDSRIGELLLDALIEMGISQEEVFYSSNFHTGVELGKNFPSEVKKNLNNSELIIFIITKNFYRSPYCMNEMGAAWAFNKSFIPILLDGLTYNDMQGFIDSHYIAIKPCKSEMYKVFSFLKQKFNSAQRDVDVEEIFEKFISAASTYATKTEKEFVEPFINTSKVEKMIMKNRFTENEILLLNFFREKQKNKLNFNYIYDYGKKTQDKSKDLLEIENYASLYGDFDYNSAIDMLVQSNFAKRNYDDFGDYYESTTLNIDIFRDLISLSEQCIGKIENIKNKYKSVNSYEIKAHTSNNEIQQFIKSNKMTEIDALLFKYMIDTTTYILGDRWKAKEEIDRIKLWEEKNYLEDMLSKNYDSALNKMKFKNFVEVHSTTSYGNPREWIFIEPYRTQLFNLDTDTVSILESVVEKNQVIGADILF